MSLKRWSIYHTFGETKKTPKNKNKKKKDASYSLKGFVGG